MVRWGPDRLCQTRLIPRSPDGDKNVKSLSVLEQEYFLLTSGLNVSKSLQYHRSRVWMLAALLVFTTAFLLRLSPLRYCCVDVIRHHTLGGGWVVLRLSGLPDIHRLATSSQVLDCLQLDHQAQLTQSTLSLPISTSLILWNKCWKKKNMYKLYPTKHYR